MGSSPTPPSYPGLSEEERSILSKQGVTLDQMNKILSQESIDAGQNQDLLRQLSGLYTIEDVPGSVGPSSSKQVFSLAKAKAYVEAGGNLNEVSRRAKEVERAGNDLAYAQSLGITDTQVTPGEAIAASKKYTLNQSAVDDLRKRVAAGQATQEELANLEQGIYKEGLLGLQAQLPQITELNQLTLDRQKRALEGTLPVSEGLLNRKAEDFAHLREAAARRGIQISGDTPETATSQSSAGNELVGQFNRTYGLLTDAERRGEITGAPNQVYTPGPASGNTYGQQLSFATAPGSGGLLGAYGNLANAYGGAAAPYANAAANTYQSQLNAYMQRQSNNLGYAQIGGSLLGGIIGSFGGPAGTAMGSMTGSRLAGDTLPIV